MWHLLYIQFYNYGACDCDPCCINIHVGPNISNGICNGIEKSTNLVI